MNRSAVLHNLGRAVFGLMAVVLVWRLWGFLGASAQLAFAPFQLDYGEGIVWQQALLMFTPEAYGPIERFPALVFHYPPLFHLATLGLAALSGFDMLAAGRLVSIGSALATAGLVGAIVARTAPEATPTSARWLAGGAGGLIIFTIWPIIFWPQLMRVDMLAAMLTTLGFLCGMRAFDRPAWIYAAALAFVAAVFTRQTSIFAPAALFVLMLWLRPRVALTGIAACVVIGLAVLIPLTIATDGGFVRHIFLYNVNRIDWGRLAIAQSTLRSHVLLLGVALVMTLYQLMAIRKAVAQRRGLSVREALLADRGAVAFLAITVYAVIGWLSPLLIIKIGSNINYLIEWGITTALLVGAALVPAATAVTGRVGLHQKTAPLLLSLFAVPFVIAAHAAQSHSLSPDPAWIKQRTIEVERLEQRIRGVSGAVVSDDMVVILRAGKRVVWEPAIFAELANMGVWDEKPFVARIRAKEFGLFIVEGERGDHYFDTRYNPAIADALDATYPVKERVGAFVVRSPALPKGRAARASGAVTR